MSTTYEVTGMTCEHCVNAVTEEVSAVPGVSAVGGGPRRGHGRGHGRPGGTVSAEAVREAVEAAGYTLS